MHGKHRFVASVTAALLGIAAGSVRLAAQGHEHMAGMAGMTTPLGISMDRMGSGTTWIPDAAPIPSFSRRVAGWDFSAHGLLFLQYIKQGGPRGNEQLGSLNWAMLMLSRPLAGGTFQM